MTSGTSGTSKLQVINIEIRTEIGANLPGQQSPADDMILRLQPILVTEMNRMNRSCDEMVPMKT